MAYHEFIPKKISSFTTYTDAELVQALEDHYAGRIDLTQYWTVGDERVIHLSAMAAIGVGESHVEQDATFVIMNVGGKTLANPINGHTECAFIVGMKDTLTTGSVREGGYINPTDTNEGGWNGCARRTWCNSVFYNAIPSSIRSIFKQHINKTTEGNKSTTIINSTDYFALPAYAEVDGGASSPHYVNEGTQFEWYKTVVNRRKYPNSTYWWERSPSSMSAIVFWCDRSGSSAQTFAASYTLGLSPFGCI